MALTSFPSRLTFHIGYLFFCEVSESLAHFWISFIVGIKKYILDICPLLSRCITNVFYAVACL